MFNLGAGEVLVIMLLALIVLGPQRLPGAARQIGKTMGDIRRLSSGFQQELRTAFDEEAETAARSRGAALTGDTATPVDAPSPAVPEPAVPELTVPELTVPEQAAPDGDAAVPAEPVDPAEPGDH